MNRSTYRLLNRRRRKSGRRFFYETLETKRLLATLTGIADGPGGSDDNWNNANNWDTNSVPSGSDSAIVAVNANADTTAPTYSGGLTLNAGTSLTIFGNDAVNALGTGDITLNTGAELLLRTDNGGGGNLTFAADDMITIAGDATIWGGRSTSGHHTTRDFEGVIAGPGALTIDGVNNNTIILDNTNTFDGFIAQSTQSQGFRVEATKPGSLGIGDVTIENAATLQIDSTDTIDDGATLTLNGSEDSRRASKLIINATETVDSLFIDGIQAPPGSYTDASGDWISGSGTLIVTNGPTDVPPTLASMDIVDDVFGGPIYEDFDTIVYTLTFSEDMDEGTIEAADFGNAGTASVTIGAITKTLTPPVSNSPSEFTVVVMPTSAGTVQFRVNQNAVLSDTLGMNLDTSSAILDDTTITINPGNTPPATITGTTGGGDSWNDPSNWDTNTVPFGPGSAIVASNVLAQVSNAATPKYEGSLTLEANSTLRINNGNSVGVVQDLANIILNDGATIDVRDGSPTFGPIAITGNVSVEAQSNGAHHETFTFEGAISGAGALLLNGLNNDTFHLDAANTFDGGFIAESNANQGFRVEANASGAFGSGNVTFNNAATLIIDAPDVIADPATLFLNGIADSRQPAKLVMNADDSVAELWIDGVQQPPGDYTAADGFIAGTGTLTVLPSFFADDDTYNAAYQTGAIAPLVIPDGPTDLLGNDFGGSLAIQEIESTTSGGPAMLTGAPASATITTDQGASVTVNADGSFTYDPTGSAAIQALDNDILTDSFTYSMTNGSATDTASVAITVSVTSPPENGDVSIFTTATAGEPVTDVDLTHSFDTRSRSSGSHSLFNGSDIQLTEGHHLVIYNSRFDSSGGGSGRTEVQTNLNLNGNDLPTGWSQGYIRRQNTQDETITAGGTIIEAADGDILQLQSFRTDSNLNEAAVRADGATGIQLIKLDDSWDYARLSSSTDQSGPTNGTFVPVQYDMQDELDAGTFSHTPGTADITLSAQGKYFVFANTFLNETQERSALIQRLTLDGTEVPGSMTMVYIRGNQNGSSDGAASIGMILETTSANQVLNVEGALDEPRSPTSYIGGRTGITIVKLPDSADYIRLEDTSNDQDLNQDSLVALNYDDATSQLEVDPSFSHSTATDPSRIGVTAAGDYLFLSSQFDLDDGVQRGFYNQGWQVNGTGGLAPYGQTGRYSRNTGGVDQFGNWSGFVTDLQAGDYVESLSVRLGNGGTNTADRLALQVVNLDSLFVLPLDAVDDDYTTSNPITEDETLSIPDGATDLLANDTPPGTPLFSFDATSANDASVTVNADGSFTYDPTGSAIIQALNSGDTLTDTFTYSIGTATNTAGEILSTDFNGRTVSGNTASNISWTTNGVADPGDLTAIETQEGDAGNQLAGLFDTGASSSHFAPDLNTDNEDNWRVEIPLTLTASSVTIDDVVLDGDHFNNSGAAQGAGRDTDFVVTVTGSASGEVASETKSTGNVTVDWMLTFFDSVAPIMLTDAETWTLAIATTNFPNNSGNNTGLDGITVNGTFPQNETDTATVSIRVTGADEFAAVNDDYTGSPISESGTLDSGAAGEPSLLANDTPSNATIVGINGTTMLTGTSVEGASVTVNPDGSFVYDTNGQFEDLAVGTTLPDSFTYTIEDGGNMATATVSLLVTGENDAPVSQAVSIAATEDGPAVMGNFNADDADTDDSPASLTYTITVPPSEGSASNIGGTFSFDPGSDFQDLAGGANRDVTFSYTATDSNSGVSNTSMVTVTVTGVNDDPTVAADNPTATANEGQTATNSGTFADIDTGDVVSLTASFGSLTQNDAAGTWDWSFDTDDGPVESGVVTITADDGQGGTATTTFDLVVDNVPPAASVTGPTEALVNSPVTFIFDATDPSTADQAAGFTFTVDWGDGSPEEDVPPASPSHTYTVDGQYTVTVTATDKDSGESAEATHVIDIIVPPDPVVQIGEDIVVTGTTGSDRIIFSSAGAGFRVRFNNEFYPLDGSVFSVNAGTQLIVNGNEGSDTVIVHGTIGAPAVFDGGEGNDYLAGGTDGDTLIGGPGNDVLLGGEGDNRLEGGDGNDRAEGRSGVDLIFGGAGNDRLNGGGGNDIIDGGSDNDFVYGGLGDDLLAGRDGADTINGYAGNDIVFGGIDADQLFGSIGNDLLIGGLGIDRVRGDSGDDVLVGGTSALETDLETSLDDLLAGGTLLPNVQTAVDAWFASQSETSRMLFEAFGDDSAADDIAGGSGVDTFQTGSNDRLRDVRAEDNVLP